MGTTLDKRISKFDNIKFITILLVVIGHVIEIPTRTDKDSDLLLCLFSFIYTFHMPLFIFISGLFEKHHKKTDKFNISKFTFLIITGFLLKVFRVFVGRICEPDKFMLSKKSTFGLLGTVNIEWFIFALAFFVLFVYLIRNIKPYITIPLSITAGCLIGFINFKNISFIVNNENDFLYLGRTLVYFPFFLAGYYLTPKKLLEITSKLYVKIPSIILLIAYFILCFRIGFSKYIPLYTGRNPYSQLAKTIPDCSVHYRLIAYLVSSVLIIGMISLIPNIRIPILTHMGQNTLGVYFWHFPLLYLFIHLGLYTYFESFGDPMWKILLLTFALILTLVLSLDIFSLPFVKLKELCAKADQKALYIICLIIAAGSVFVHYIILK